MSNFYQNTPMNIYIYGEYIYVIRRINKQRGWYKKGREDGAEDHSDADL